jgi:hypothetical protein
MILYMARRSAAKTRLPASPGPTMSPGVGPSPAPPSP